MRYRSVTALISAFDGVQLCFLFQVNVISFNFVYVFPSLSLPPSGFLKQRMDWFCSCINCIIINTLFVNCIFSEFLYLSAFQPAVVSHLFCIHSVNTVFVNVIFIDLVRLSV